MFHSQSTYSATVKTISSPTENLKFAMKSRSVVLVAFGHFMNSPILKLSKLLSNDPSFTEALLLMKVKSTPIMKRCKKIKRNNNRNETKN